MPNLMYTLVDDGENQFVTVFVPGEMPLSARDDHPNFARIVSGAADGDTAVIDLFDVSQTVGRRFERLSDRVTAANGRVYLDGDEINSALTKQILRFLDEDVNDWAPLVAFFEKVQANPQEHSREQLFEWLDRHDFTLTPDGDIVGYKGVRKNPDGSLVSISHGPAIVDGVAVNGAVPNGIGSTVEMARSSVTFDPAVGCSRGLHVGTYDYAKGFSQGAVLEVHVNPRDVVSVPTDCNWQKVRCCRYQVVDVIDTPYTSAVLDDDGADFEDDEVDEWDF